MLSRLRCITQETRNENGKARIYFTYYMHTSSKNRLLLRSLNIARLCLAEVDDVPNCVEVLHTNRQSPTSLKDTRMHLRLP